MVKGRIYKLANLHKNKRNHLLVSYTQGIEDGIGWLWTSNYHPRRHSLVFQDGDAFVCLGKKNHSDHGTGGVAYYGITTWYEAVGPDGKVHKITPAMRSSYFRSP
jgi:hypothetical protein